MSITIRSAQTIRNGLTLKGSLGDFILYLDAANPASYPGSGTTWYDLSGNHYDATLYNSAQFVDNRAINFNFASDQYAAIAPANMFNGDFTIVSWVYVRTYKSWSRIIDFGNGAGVDNVVLAVTDGTSGVPVFSIDNGNVDSDQTLPRNQWAQLAASQAGSISTLYINGFQVQSFDNGEFTIPSVTRNYNYIGRSNWGGDAFLDGEISQLKIYSRALTQAELVTDYNLMLGRFS
jgi:hypothetical protein